MLKWKRVSVTAAAGYEEIEDALAGMSGKNRVIKFFAETAHSGQERLRIYRDAEQCVDIDANFLTSQAPFLPVDISLAEGQLCKVGFYNGSGAEHTRILVIGYEETG